MITDNDSLWSAIAQREGKVFTTHRGKAFSFHLKTNKAGEMQSAMVIDPGKVNITRATVLLAFHSALEVQAKKGCVKSPGKLGTFGAAYLYPVFLDIGICTDKPGMQNHMLLQQSEPEPEPERAGNPPGVCENCGYTLGEDFEFCPKCGRKIETAGTVHQNMSGIPFHR